MSSSSCQRISNKALGSSIWTAVLLGVVSTVGILGITAAASYSFLSPRQRRRGEGPSQKKRAIQKNGRPQSPNNNDHDEEEESTESALPPHIQRAIYKAKRQKQSVRALARKSPMYDNIFLYSQSGTLLSTISRKKARWYIRKQLGVWKNDSTETTDDANGETAVQLLFEPPAITNQTTTIATSEGTNTGEDDKGTTVAPSSPKGEIRNESAVSFTPSVYAVSRKQNICVCCGKGEPHMRHYIVPYVYRQLFPTHYKTHLSHDICILCPDCSMYCQQATQRKQRQMEFEARRQRNLHHDRYCHPMIPNPTLYRVKNAATALSKQLQGKAQLPVCVQQRYETLIRDHFTATLATKGDSSSVDGNSTIHEAAHVEKEVEHESQPPGFVAAATESGSSVHHEDAGNDDDDTAELQSLLEQATQLPTHEVNPDYVPGSPLVVPTRKDNDEGDCDRQLNSFIREWRHHFLDTMHPRFLPSGWSVDSPTQCDRGR